MFKEKASFRKLGTFLSNKILFISGLLHIYQPVRSGRIWHKVSFKRSLTCLKSEFFFILEELPNQGWRTQSSLLFTHSWKENHWINTFPKGITAIWNANSIIQDLNSCRRVHFPTTITITLWAPLFQED